MDELKVGSVVWREVDRYHRSTNMAPEEKFRPITIIGETRVSWLAKDELLSWSEFKFPKKKPASEYHKDPDTRLAKSGRNGASRIYLTQRAVDDEVWGIKNREPLRKHIDELLNLVNRGEVAELRRVAALIGYKETT